MQHFRLLLRWFAAAILSIGILGQGALAAVQVVIDADEMRTSPSPHRYIHGTILDDAKFQLLLPTTWNGKIMIFSRGFSGTEFSTDSWVPPALAKGYAFATSDEGWNRVTIVNEPEDSYYESRQRLLELTLYVKERVVAQYGQAATRVLMTGGSNGGHHTKMMVEDFPLLFDGGIAGYGFNSQISMWGSMATTIRNYDIIAPRINDIVTRRSSTRQWDPFTQPLSPPLTPEQIQALRNIYDIPAQLVDGFQFNVGRWQGSESQLRSQYSALVGYLHDSMPRFDPTFNPDGGALLDSELGQWRPELSPQWVKRELRKLDLSGYLERPVLIMHGTADPIVSPGEAAGYKALVEARLGKTESEKLLALYYIPGMGHGGTQYNNLIGAQIDALEAWITYRQSGGTLGAPAPAFIGIYPREPAAGSDGAGLKETAGQR
jgi:pimeloyl-ACP methyl ester carboxylesterase